MKNIQFPRFKEDLILLLPVFRSLGLKIIFSFYAYYFFCPLCLSRFEVTLGTIHILRQHNFGLFWPTLHLLCRCEISINTVLNVSKTGNFLDPPIQSFVDVIYGWSLSLFDRSIPFNQLLCRYHVANWLQVRAESYAHTY